MTAARALSMTTAQSAVILDFTPASASMASNAERHNRNRQLRLKLFKSPMPISPMDIDFVGGLGPGVERIWWKLAIRFWIDGPIPDDPGVLAKAAGVTSRKWARYAPTLGSMFQRDQDGAWTDYALAEARGLVLQRFYRAEARRAARLKSCTPHTSGSLIQAPAQTVASPSSEKQ